MRVMHGMIRHVGEPNQRGKAGVGIATLIKSAAMATVATYLTQCRYDLPEAMRGLTFFVPGGRG